MKYALTAKRLSDILTIRGMKAQELADKAGVNKASISQYINGSHKPSNLSSGKMAQILRCNPLWLMGFDVEMEATEMQEVQTAISKRLLAYMERLNPEGIKKLEERAEELTEIAKYTKKEENITESKENL